MNAGSNTLAMLKIEPSDPWHPTLVGTADTMGEFPMSVAYSDSLQTGMRSSLYCAYAIYTDHGQSAYSMVAL